MLRRTDRSFAGSAGMWRERRSCTGSSRAARIATSSEASAGTKASRRTPQRTIDVQSHLLRRRFEEPFQAFLDLDVSPVDEAVGEQHERRPRPKQGDRLLVRQAPVQSDAAARSGSPGRSRHRPDRAATAAGCPAFTIVASHVVGSTTR